MGWILYALGVVGFIVIALLLAAHVFVTIAQKIATF